MNTFLIIMLFLLMPILIIGILVSLEGWRRRIIRKILEKAVNELIRENQLLIMDIEFFRNKIIGIDTEKKKLVFVENRRGGITQVCIDLNLLSYCNVNKAIDKSSNVMEKIFLKVKCKGIKRAFRLCFYDSSYDNTSVKRTMFEKALQWRSKINLHKKSVILNDQFEYELNVNDYGKLYR